ncbi:SusC/RagA family TonB-linked outer membrane protein [Maribacter algicola]|uniref:SusC/RagA family TonB-linked outer membrane protein n=1 Tax=Meishania litoralis TaxID=3434685 RepID=A0ACC7LFN2_9FLAO
MRTKFNGILTLLLAFVVQMTFAQEKTITGTVTDQDGLPLPGVNIVVQGTTSGTQTDFDGNYSINGEVGQVLSFTYIGQKEVQVTIGANDTVNVQMQEDAQALEEVVVTAQGIKREKKALGYATSSVGEEALEQRAEGDVARVLAGKASGVQITAAGGMSGSATSVTIRGLSSFSGSNQALFIVDGIPFSNDTNNNGNDFLSGNTGSSRFLDIDPNNIENIEVLKGLAATTLYGTLGKNGVILITTKAGAANGGVKKNEISVSTSYFVNEYASLPDYQQSYGGGFDQSFGWFFSNWGPSFEEGGTAGWGAQPAIDANATLEHPYSTTAIAATRDAFPELQGARYAWRPYSSVEDFFAPGYVTNTSVNFSGGSQDGNTTFNANLGHLNDVGFTPGNQLKRVNFSVGGRSKLSNKFTITGAMNYSRTDYDTPPVSASRGNGGISSNSIYGAVLFTPISVDLMGLPYENPVTGGSVYYRNGNDIINPRWVAEHIKFNQLTNRFYFNTSLNYELSENLGVTWRSGLDFYTERNTQFSDKGGVEFTFDIFGFLNTFDNNNTIWDHTLSFNGNYDLSEKIGLTFNLGANARSDAFDLQGVASTGQLVYGVRRHFNYENQLPIQFSRKRNIVGVFGDVSFDYDNYLFLNFSARRDWVSNLIKENRSLTYPGGSISFLPTAAFSGLQSENGLNYLKLRASYGTSANFPEGYPTVSGVDQTTQVSGGTFGPITTNSISNFKANPDLKPELLKEFEVGFESKFWKNRVSLDATYYDRRTDDLIVFEPLSPSTGFTITQNNIGQISNKGIEADLGIDLFRSEDGFNWKSSVNFFTNKEIVEEQEQDIIFYSGNTALFIGANAAIKGESLGTIVGTAFLRDEAGNLLTNDAGNYVITESDLDGNVPIIGDAVPDYTMNFINSLSYKNWSLGFQVNHIKGGDIMSSTIATLLGRGLIVETEDRLNTYILPGVNQNSGQPNDIQLNNSTYFFSNLLFGPAEAKIYDASVLRLQEVSLGYSLPKKALEKTPFGSLTFTLQGFNLWYDAYNTPDGANFDPNVAGVGVGNGRGFDFLNGPSTRRYGMSVKMTF